MRFDHADFGQQVENRRDEIVAFARQLVKFDTTSPSPSQAGKDIGACQDYVLERLKRLGLVVERWETDPARLKKYPLPLCSYEGISYKDIPTVAGRLRGTANGRSLVMNGHVDTVPVRNPDRWQHDPWSGDLAEGRIHGRGSADMKGGVACMIEALAALIEMGMELRGDIIVEIVPDEENYGLSTISCIDRGYRADAGLSTEPTKLRITPALRGLLWGKITVEGRPGHAEVNQSHWREGGGVNAITKAISLLEALEDLSHEWVKRADKIHYILDTPEIVPTIVRGGEFESIIPEKCEIVINTSYLPKNCDSNGRGSLVKKEIEQCVEKRARADQWLSGHQPRIEWLGDWYPAEIEESHPLVVETKNACKEHGIEPVVWGGFGTIGDAIYLSKIGDIPCVTFGPGNIHVAHGSNEFVPVDELIAATKTIGSIIARWCA